MKAISQFIGQERPRRTDNPDEGGLMTKQGWLSHTDIGQAGGRFVKDRNGNRVLQFPCDVDAGRPMYRTIPEHKLAEGV